MNLDMNPRIEVDHKYEFTTGEPVTVLYQGRHDGMDGRFIGLRPDTNWADVADSNGVVHAHPVLWLRPARTERADPLG